jgi:hypothetical protein
LDSLRPLVRRMEKTMATTKKEPYLILWGAGTPRTMRPHWMEG